MLNKLLFWNFSPKIFENIILKWAKYNGYAESLWLLIHRKQR